jgi:hypothetical protein
MLHEQITQKPFAAVFYDCDDVLNNARGENPTSQSGCIVDQDGNMGGTTIGVEKLRKIMQFCIEHHIPLYIVTARPEREWHKNFIIHLINEIGGFHDGIGGFKQDHIHCLGLEQYSQELKRPHVERLIVKDKLTRIEEIYQSQLRHIPKNRILFVDDDLRNLEPVKKAGYTTIRAHIGNDSHHDQTLDFLKAIAHTPVITTHGHYAVLEKPEDLNPQGRAALKQNEFFEPAEEELLNGWYWRKRWVPDLNDLSHQALEEPKKRELYASDLTLIGAEQAIFFTNDIHLITRQIMEHSYGTLTSIEDLSNKKYIILVGSQGQRKIEPIIQALKDLNHSLFNECVLIGLPADSGVSCQPVGHREILLGCENRLNQVRCFEYGLDLLLKTQSNIQPKTIISVAIENGIGLFPVETIENDGVMQFANTPLTSIQEKTQFHFYDQAHILCHAHGTTHHRVAKPTRINYTLISDELDQLKAYFENDTPTALYYLEQSKWSREMLKRLDSTEPHLAYPYRYEADDIPPLSSNALIQERMYELFASVLNKMVPLPKRFEFFTTNNSAAKEETPCTAARTTAPI